MGTTANIGFLRAEHPLSQLHKNTAVEILGGSTPQRTVLVRSVIATFAGVDLQTEVK
jgi:hypothetical protein